MRILVSGSLRDIREEWKEPLRQAAQELGAALAAAGHTVLLGSDNPQDVDPYVADGVASAPKPSPIEVHLMRGAPPCFAHRGDSVENVPHRYDDWDVTVLEVVRYQADGVIVIAGRQGVVQAGIAGWMLGKATIPFGGFGGGGEKVWNYGSSDRARFYFGALSDIDIDHLNGPWELGKTGPRIVQQLEQCAEYARRASVSMRLRAGVSFGILLSLISWVLLLALPLLGWPGAPNAAADGTPAISEATSGIRFLLLLGCVCSAGVFGALVQSMRSLRDGASVTGQRASMDAVLGVAAGFLTAALYLLAQIAITGKLELPADNANYSRVALIVSMAAVFASLYIDSAFSRFDEVKQTVMGGTYGKKS
jgi:hypothetical protein